MEIVVHLIILAAISMKRTVHAAFCSSRTARLRNSRVSMKVCYSWRYESDRNETDALRKKIGVRM